MHDYEFLFAHSADSMCEVDSEGRFLRVNAACERLLEREESPTSKLPNCFDAKGCTQLTQRLHELTSVAPTATFVGHQHVQDRWTSWRLTRLEENRIVGVGRDVTAHHKTASDLEEKSSFLHSIIEAEPECVKLVSREGELLDMNPAGLELIAAPSREAAMGANVYDLVAPEDRERFIEFNERICAGQSGTLSFDIIAMDGTRRSMETSAVPFSQPGNSVGTKPLVHLAITRDVTRRRMLEDQLRQAQKIKAIGHLAGGIAHDFNNLLTAIIGPAELALASLGENHPVAGDLREIKATGERAARLTQKLLTFARQQVVQLEALSMGELTASLREMLERLLGETFELDIDIDPEASPVHADRGHLEQVVLNLTVNARDAMPNGGRIRIRIQDEVLPESLATRLGCSSGSYVVLEVQDEGTGIAPETLPHIFDPFFTTKAQGKGTGLGLSTCHGIVNQMNGAIDVHSVVDHGTTMKVYLPRTTLEKPTANSSKAPVRRGGETILVAEDESLVRSTIVRMLESEGYTVHQAASGAEALEESRRIAKFDLLITDMAMPGMRGRELARRLNLESPGVKVLFLTGYLRPPVGSPEDAHEHALVLHKPFTSQDLCEAVRRALEAEEATAPTS